jgi:pyruvate/2-oxoglutarate dehydrogenase complex dihydrolipoamide acyltransferase (E2) component
MSAEGRTDPALSRNPKPPPLGGGEFTPVSRVRIIVDASGYYAALLVGATPATVPKMDWTCVFFKDFTRVPPDSDATSSGPPFPSYNGGSAGGSTPISGSPGNACIWAGFFGNLDSEIDDTTMGAVGTAAAQYMGPQTYLASQYITTYAICSGYSSASWRGWKYVHHGGGYYDYDLALGIKKTNAWCYMDYIENILDYVEPISVGLALSTAGEYSLFSVPVGLPVDSGEAVKSGQPLFDVEHSKATMEICASVDGFVLHGLTKGASVTFGSRIACVVDAIDAERSLPTSSTGTLQPTNASSSALVEATLEAKVPPAPTRASSGDKFSVGLAYASTSPGGGSQPKFSRAAAKLADQFGLTGADFKLDLVSTADVREKIDAGRTPGQRPPGRRAAAPLMAEALSGSGLAERILPRKSEEINLLQNGAGNTTQSTLGVRIGKIRARREAGDTFEGKILDLVVFEASRLMKQCPKLNAAFSENQIIKFDSVNAGVAFDDGAKLVVYGIENSNLKDLGEIREEIEDSIGRYLNDRLTLREMTRATFTVTDLSATPMDFVLPILPDRQSCIIGVTRNSKEEFSIYAGFDHRVTEGREVAFFLDQLADRIGSFDRERANAEPARCFFCQASAGDGLNDDKRGLLKIVRPGGDEVLCCNTC